MRTTRQSFIIRTVVQSTIILNMKVSMGSMILALGHMVMMMEAISTPTDWMMSPNM